MQKKFFALCFLIGALGAVSVQAAESWFSFGSKKKKAMEHDEEARTPWLQRINNAAVCVAAVNVPLQVTGYAATYAQTVLPLFAAAAKLKWVGGALGTIGGTAAKYVITPTLTTGYGLPFLAMAALTVPIVVNPTMAIEYCDNVKKTVLSWTMLKILGAGALLAGAGLLATRSSTSPISKIS